jgi:mycothiol synthase
MSENGSPQQLRMVWPEHLLDTPPGVRLPVGYSLRLYRPGEPRFYEIMALAGWHGWDDRVLQPSLAKMLPGGWFMAIHEQSDEIVATAMPLHNYGGKRPFWGELGWLAGDPAHSGKGLGMAVSAAVTARSIAAGHRRIHLFTEDFRLAALKTYLKVGYVPSLHSPDMQDRWQAVCEQLGWPYAPDAWGSIRPGGHREQLPGDKGGTTSD